MRLSFLAPRLTLFTVSQAQPLFATRCRLRFHTTMTTSTGPSPALTFKYVYLGAGNSAGYAAKALAEMPGEHLSAGLALVGAENELPYERPALSKAVLFNESVRLPGFSACVGGGGEKQGVDWYKDHSVTTLLGETVTEVDLATKTLTTASGKTIVAEEALFLATGASPIRLDKMPGGTLDNVVYLREYSDALQLYDLLHANKETPILVVGGGYIGLEVAAAAATVGCADVTMIFPEEHVMPRLFTPEIAAYYEKAYNDKGVNLLKSGRVCKAFVDDGCGAVKAATICSSDGEESDVPAKLVVVGIGARPNTQLFKGQLDMDKQGGVVVDCTLKTSVDGVYAVGDIATFPLKMYGGRPTRVEHVTNARMTAAHAVRAAVSGSKDEYDYLPYFYSRVFGLSWQFFGDNVGDCVVVGDFDPTLAAFWIKDGKVVGVFCESPSDENTASMKRVAVSQPSGDADKLKAANSVDAAFAMLQ
jgi:monodehydroascorbate reductase (NADH)